MAERQELSSLQSTRTSESSTCREGDWFNDESTPIDDLYQRADDSLHSFHSDCGGMLVALDSFQTAAGGGKGPGMMAKAVIATVIATIADLESSGLPTLPCHRLPGLEVAQHALKHEESRRAWILWQSLSEELLVMIRDVENYFADANYCASLPQQVEEYVHTVSIRSETRVIDLRKLSTVVSYNTIALLESASEFHSALYRIKTRTLEAVSVLETLHKPAKLKRVKELGSAASKIQAYDPLLVLEHFESGIRDFLMEVRDC